jgi:AGZA family xanthine/uracil permease-like MFS transporter
VIFVVSFGPFPVVVVALVAGTGLGWATSLNDIAQVREAYRLMKGYKMIFPIGEMFKHMDEIMPYLSTTIPTAVANAVATIQCVESARRAGDVYATQEAMFADGIGTLISSFFGSFLSMTSEKISPYQMMSLIFVLAYIGHPAIKRMGGKQGYSLVNGVVFLPLCYLGINAFIMSLIAIVAVNPIVVSFF